MDVLYKKFVILYLSMFLVSLLQAAVTTHTTVWNISSDYTIPSEDTVVLQNGLQMSNGVTLTNHGVIICENNLFVSRGTIINAPTGIIEIENYNITFTSYTPTHEGNQGTHFMNNGLVRGVNSNFTLYPQDNPYSNQTGVTVINSGVFDFTDCEFVVRNNNKKWAAFVNETNALVTINNENSTKNVYFGLDDADAIVMCDIDNSERNSACIHLQANSNFYVSQADLYIFFRYASPNLLEGRLIVEDGNAYLDQAYGGGGTNFTVEFPFGGLYLVDTDDSGDDDGMLSISGAGGGTTFTVDGELYSVGVITESGGGGNSVVVADGGMAYIGNLGASMVDQFEVTVESNGVLNYCGNLTSGADDVGTIEDGGTLNYAQSFYEEDPYVEDDFIFDGSVDASMNALYEDSAQCVAHFNEGVQDVLGEVLPIELSFLKAKRYNDDILIEWQTLSEDNNSHFTLYRSFDGINFNEIAVILGAGISHDVRNYTYTDDISHDGLVYYKLDHTDFDGATQSYSKIIVVPYSQKSHETIFDISSDQIIVNFSNPYVANHILITSIDGKIIDFSCLYVGKKSVVIPNRFPTGVYVITNYSQNYIVSRKFINNDR
ncbi:MAG: hypothetical protein ACOCWB_05935 [Bacteroidota bacterium]